MTTELGSGDRYFPAFPAGRKSSDPLVGDQPTFLAREYFLDTLIEELPSVYEDFRSTIEPVFRQVFDLPKSSADGEEPSREAVLRELVKASGSSWEWPPADPIFSPKAGPSPYAQAFEGWPPPMSRGAWKEGLSPDSLRRLHTSHRCWSFHGWLLSTLLQTSLDNWSERNRLSENVWVASHLLARSCKARLYPPDDPAAEVKLDHLVFPSPGVLARFLPLLNEAFSTFRDWDPTQESWKDWLSSAEDRFRDVTKTYRERVDSESEARGLEKRRGKREAERDFRRLVRFQVLEETLQDLRPRSEDVSAVQKSITRTAELVGLRLRTTPS